jgi:MEMO1 family protein
VRHAPAGGIRAPAVAGRFYPADPTRLSRLVDDLVAAAAPPPGAARAAGYVVPHAGYRYSGPTAAQVYARLRGCAGGLERVLLFGPAHYARLHGCAVPLARAWHTPLGDVPIDTDAAHGLASAGVAVADDEPFAPEHSLEVQLPFLQRCLPGTVPVLPVAVGVSTVDEVGGVLEALAGAGTLVLCSTDLSHYQDLQAAQEQDARTAAAVLDLAPRRVGVRDACGVFALRALLAWAGRSRLRPRLLALATSADSSGDTSRVVGYGAFAFDPAVPDPAPA